MKVRRVGVELDGIAVRTPHALAHQMTLSHRDGTSTDNAILSHQTRAYVGPTLPEELTAEILLCVPPDMPAHLVRAALVCKAWRRILSDDNFRRRYRRFHRTPPLQGYIYGDSSNSTIRFVPTRSSAVVPPVCAPRIYNRSCSWLPSAMDCRHGRVLIKAEVGLGSLEKLIVWDPIDGSQKHLSVPPDPQNPYVYGDYICVGAVLCAKDGCDHLDCHGGPFLVVLLEMSREDDFEEGVTTWEIWAIVYSSETSVWIAATTANVITNKSIEDTSPSLLIGDALYFTTVSWGYSIVKYDLCKHHLSVIVMPGELFEPILIKGEDGGLGLATMSLYCIYMWSLWQVDDNGDGGSVKYRVIRLDDTAFIHGRNRDRLFTLDLKSRRVRYLGKTEDDCQRPILPYMSFYTPK